MDVLQLGIFQGSVRGELERCIKSYTSVGGKVSPFLLTREFLASSFKIDEKPLLSTLLGDRTSTDDINRRLSNSAVLFHQIS